MLGTVLKQQGKAAAALAALKQAISLDDSSPGPHMLIAQLLRSAGDIEGSRKAFAIAAERKRQKEAEQKTMFDRSRSEMVGAVLRP